MSDFTSAACARIHALAKQSGRSAHSFILEAVERHADYEEQMRSLVKEALAADEEIERTGEVYPADDVHTWVERLARGQEAAHPLLGRRVHGDFRELVISYGQTGYIALYRFVVPQSEARVLAIRHQLEIGFVP